MLRVCKHCNQQFETADKPKGWMANHSRWCDLNPKRADYINNMSKARASITCDSIEKRSISLKEAHKRGSYDHVDHKTFLGRRHSDESIQKIRLGALNSNHRRLRRGIVEYKGVLLDSSWELTLAKRLDQLGIVWTRPDPLKWIDEFGVSHNYFPDFYLPDYDLYLDPKNPHAAKVQKNKLTLLLRQYNNIHIISSLSECEKFNIEDIL